MPINPNASSTTGNCVGNVYMADTLSPNSDAALLNGMFLPTTGQNFPVLPNSLTPSVNCYMGQNERFEYFRRRFLTQQVSIYQAPFTSCNNLISTLALSPSLNV